MPSEWAVSQALLGMAEDNPEELAHLQQNPEALEARVQEVLPALNGLEEQMKRQGIGEMEAELLTLQALEENASPLDE